MAKKNTASINYGRYFEYVMSKEMAKNLLDNRNDLEKKMRPQEYLCKIVNEQFGIMGTCSKVSYN